MAAVVSSKIMRVQFFHALVVGLENIQKRLLPMLAVECSDSFRVWPLDVMLVGYLFAHIFCDFEEKFDDF